MSVSQPDQNDVLRPIQEVGNSQPLLAAAGVRNCHVIEVDDTTSPLESVSSTDRRNKVIITLAVIAVISGIIGLAVYFKLGSRIQVSSKNASFPKQHHVMTLPTLNVNLEDVQSYKFICYCIINATSGESQIPEGHEWFHMEMFIGCSSVMVSGSDVCFSKCSLQIPNTRPLCYCDPDAFKRNKTEIAMINVEFGGLNLGRTCFKND